MQAVPNNPRLIRNSSVTTSGTSFCLLPPLHRLPQCHPIRLLQFSLRLPLSLSTPSSRAAESLFSSPSSLPLTLLSASWLVFPFRRQSLVDDTRDNAHDVPWPTLVLQFIGYNEAD